MITYKRSGVYGWVVLIDDEPALGRACFSEVWRHWNGGYGWTHSLADRKIFKTRWEAAENLIAYIHP